MRKDKYLTQQRIHEERGAYERARKRKFLHLKRTHQLDKYYQQKAGIKVKKKTIRDYELGKPRISIWQKFKAIIFKLIHNAKELLRSLRKRTQA